MPTDAQLQPDPIAPKPKRRWLQFGLRTLLGMIALFGIGLGLIVVPAERQRRAVASLHRLGAVVYYERHEERWADAPAWFQRLLAWDYFSSAIIVDLTGAQVSDAELEKLKGLPLLQGLVLRENQVTDAGLTHLKGLTRLEMLDLADTQVTDAGREHLKELTRLEWLRLDNTQATDAGLEPLIGLTRLRWLGLRDTQVTDAGIGELRLALPQCEVTGP